jgi:hypothetical protein
MARQTELKGFEHPHGDKELDEMIEGRRKTSKQRKKWQDREVEEGDAILAKLREKGIKFYVNRNFNPPLYAKLKAGAEKLEIDEYEEGTGGSVDAAEELPDVEPGSQKATKKSAPAEA